VITVAEAVRIIVTTTDVHEAAATRNEVALQAMRGLRPESEADTCRDAYFARWSDAVLDGHQRTARNLSLYRGE